MNIDICRYIVIYHAIFYLPLLLSNAEMSFRLVRLFLGLWTAGLHPGGVTKEKCRRDMF